MTIPGELAGVVGEELLTVARRARDAGDPGAGAVFGLAAQLGVVVGRAEEQAQPAAEPEPQPAEQQPSPF